MLLMAKMIRELAMNASKDCYSCFALIHEADLRFSTLASLKL